MKNGKHVTSQDETSKRLPDIGIGVVVGLYIIYFVLCCMYVRLQARVNSFVDRVESYETKVDLLEDDIADLNQRVDQVQKEYKDYKDYCKEEHEDLSKRITQLGVNAILRQIDERKSSKGPN